MAKNFLEQLQSIDLGGGLSAAKPLTSLTELVGAETPGEKQAGRLEAIAGQFQQNTPLTAILKGVAQGVASGKRSKAEEERAQKLAAIEAQTQYALQQAQYADGMKKKLDTYQLAELEKTQNQQAIGEAVLLAKDSGVTKPLLELVNGNQAWKAVIEDQLDAPVKGIEITGEGNLILVGENDATMRMPFTSLLAPEQRAAYVENQKAAADLAKTEAETSRINNQAANPPMKGYQYGEGGNLVPIPGGPADTARQKNLNDEAQQYSQYLDKNGLVELGTALGRVQQTIAQYQDENGNPTNMPGVGVAGAWRPDFAAGKEGRSLRQQLLSVGNLLIKARTGAAMSNAEAGRIGREIGVDISGDKPVIIGTSEDSIRRGIQMGQEVLTNRLNAIKAGYDPEAIALYEKRLGTSQDTPKAQEDSQPQPGSLPSMDAIDAELRRRGAL